MNEEKKEGLPASVLLSLGVIIWGAYWLGSFFTTYVMLPELTRIAVYSVGVLGAVCYYVGFWRVVREKGRHTVWFLLSFTWLIGVVVIYLLPERDIQSAQVNPCNPPENPRIT